MGTFARKAPAALAGDVYADVYGQSGGLDALESVNAGWMDALWHGLGQTGPVGGAEHAFVEEFYEKIKKGETQPLRKAVRRFYEKSCGPSCAGVSVS